MPTVEDALYYLGIDYADDMVKQNVQTALDAAVSVLYGAVGSDVREFLPDDARVKTLIMAYMADFYNERYTEKFSTGQKASSAQRHLIQTMEWQVKLELRRLRSDANAV